MNAGPLDQVSWTKSLVIYIGEEQLLLCHLIAIGRLNYTEDVLWVRFNPAGERDKT
jgi:hypothetical protein